MEEKKYLKWYNKIGYGSGDVAGNVVYALYHFKYFYDGLSDGFSRACCRCRGYPDCRIKTI